MKDSRDHSPPLSRHAVILAAGESKRTRPLTSQRPKPLIPLLRRPLLAHILDQCVGLVERVTLVVGYRAAAIAEHFGSTYRGIELGYVHQQQTNGTAGALLTVADQLDEPFFLLYGDNLISQVDLLAVGQHRYALAALRVADPCAFGVLDVADGCVQRIIEKPADPPPDALANPGIYHFAPDVCGLLEQIQPSARGEYELTDLIALLATQHCVHYSICNGFWVPVGNPWEALNASQFLLQQRASLQQHRDPQAVIAADAVIDGSVVIGRARIGAGSRISGPAVIGDGVTIGAGCSIVQSVIDDDAIIDRATTIEHSAIGARAQIGAGCLVQSSLLDSDTRLGDDVQLPEALFPELRPVACTAGLLAADRLRLRGAILGPGVELADASRVAAGSVLAAASPAA